MKSVSAAVLTATVMLSAVAAPGIARAENGQVAAGVAGGLLGGMLLGGALAQPPRYAPAPVYVEEPPVYVERPSRCYMARGEPVWDDYRGMWHRPRVQVCD
jgi:hypothetical protein